MTISLSMARNTISYRSMAEKYVGERVDLNGLLHSALSHSFAKKSRFTRSTLSPFCFIYLFVSASINLGNVNKIDENRQNAYCFSTFWYLCVACSWRQVLRKYVSGAHVFNFISTFIFAKKCDRFNGWFTCWTSFEVALSSKSVTPARTRRKRMRSGERKRKQKTRAYTRHWYTLRAHMPHIRRS